MKHGEGQSTDEETDEKLRDYCVRVIRFISNSVMDPHLYFEKKLTGDVTVAVTTEELLGILTGLVEWIEEMYGPFPNFSGSRLSGPDRELGRDGLPTLSLLATPATRKAGLVLACGRTRSPDEFRLVAELAENATIAETDRDLAQRLLAAHEQA
jgi:hypothetical protein